MQKAKIVFTLILLSAFITMLVPIGTVGAAETLLWEEHVLSDGVPVLSPVLEASRVYRIVSRKVFYYQNENPRLAADAQYYTTGTDTWHWTNHFPAPDGHSFLQINGMDVDWGPYSEHTYSIYYIGEGAPISLAIVDWVDEDYTNNGCKLSVMIFEGRKLYGCTPGFWKNHPGSWPMEYSPGDQLRSVFGSCALDVTFMKALQLHGGSRLMGAMRILARAAVAALLNTATFGDSYWYTESQVIEMVSYQFCHGDRDSIIDLAYDLDYWNNMGCPPCWP